METLCDGIRLASQARKQILGANTNPYIYIYIMSFVDGSRVGGMEQLYRGVRL